MSKTVKFLFPFVLTIFFQFCGKFDFCDCLNNSEIDSIKIELQDIDSMEIYHKFNVYLLHDTVNEAIIRANRNLIEQIEITEKNKFLKIEDKNDCNFLRNPDINIDIYLHLKNLEKIFLYGPSTIISEDTLRFEKLLIRIYDDIGDVDIILKNNRLWLEYWYSTGTARIQGSTNFFEILNHGYAHIHAFDFESKYVSVNHNSTGNVEIYPLESIDARLQDIGNIFYTGSPKIINILEKKSTGELIHVD